MSNDTGEARSKPTRTCTLSGLANAIALTSELHAKIAPLPTLGRHVILTLFFVELALLLRGGILVLLVLRHEIIHIRLCLCKLHLVHALSCVPVQEGFAPEHGREILCHAFEHLLNCRRISRESNSHLRSFRGNVTDARFDIIRNPFYEIRV